MITRWTISVKLEVLDEGETQPHLASASRAYTHDSRDGGKAEMGWCFGQEVGDVVKALAAMGLFCNDGDADAALRDFANAVEDCISDHFGDFGGPAAENVKPEGETP